MNILSSIGLSCIVLPAVGDVRPAVVSSRPYYVDLVSALRSVIQEPQFAGLRIESQPLRILESMRPRLGEHRRTTQPWIVARNRSVSIDMHHPPCEIAPFVRIVEKRMLHAVQFRLVQPKPVGA